MEVVEGLCWLMRAWIFLDYDGFRKPMKVVESLRMLLKDSELVDVSDRL